METLFHETSHNILHNNLSNPPRWLNEGIATLLGYLVETTDNQIMYMPQARFIRPVRDSIRARSFNFSNLFNNKATDWVDKDKRPMLYATSYCLIYFLINQERDQLEPMLVLMKEGYSTNAAIKKLFGSNENFVSQFSGFYANGPGKRF